MGKKDKRAAAMMGPLLLVANLALADPTYQFDIRGATLDAALRQFADQTGLQISYFSKLAEGRTAPTVFGKFTAEEALQALLEASGLMFERIDQGTVAIYPAAPARTIMEVPKKTAVDSPTRPEFVRLEQDARRGSNGGTQDPRSEHTLEEVIATGSHIRGVVNDTAPKLVLDRQYIERSGFTNMMQLVNSLPMNFRGSSATEVAEYGQAPNYGQNLTRGTGFNLHGLGSVSTLTLIDGRRVAPAAQGQFVDVSTIPLSAVERIEILSDGASAIYGADAVAGVVNIILRKDFEGAETGWQYGSTSDDSLDEHRLSQTLGTRWKTGNALFIAEYYRRSNLDMGDRDYILDAGGVAPTDLLPRRKLGAMLFTLDQQLPANFELSTDLMYAYEEVAFHSTLYGFLEEQTPDTNQWSAALGLAYSAPGDWRIALDGVIARVKPNTDFTYSDLDTGEIDTQLQDYRDEYDTWSTDLKADGPLFRLPGGLLRLAVGGSYRKDDLISTRYRTVPNVGREVRADESRNVTSVFAELYVPIVGAAQNLAWARRIDLSVAGRHDDYSDFGSTDNPKVGVVWTPVDGLDIRASYSKSFRAPNMAEKALVSAPLYIATGMFDDPSGNGAQIPMFYLMGSNVLTAENSENLALGFTLRPSSLSGFELSMSYFEVDYKDRIQAVPYDGGALSHPDKFGDLITEFADDTAAAKFLADRLAAGAVFTDWECIGSSGVRYLYDLRQQNAARTQLRGLDASMLYQFKVAQNAFDLQFNLTHLNEILTSLAAGTATFDLVDTYNLPLDWRFRLMGTWLRGDFSSTFVVNHADNYTNDSNVVDVPVGSWTTADVNVTYTFDRQTQPLLLAGTRIVLGISNITDREPPRAISPMYPVGYDVFNADAMGRFITARFSKRW